VVCVRAELTAQPLEPVIAIVGRIDPEKGVPTVVSAVRSLNDAGLRCSLVVVGASSRGHECYQAETIAAATATLGDRVRFVGIRADIVEVLRSVDVLVNASDAEPFGLSVLEAQACGVPVVCANAGGIPDFVADGTTGLLFSAGRAGQLAAALSRLFRTAGLAERLATAGVKQVHEQYSLPARADAIAGIYRQATGRHWPHLSARGAGRSSSMARPNSVTSYFRDQYDHSR
jgi:glycosyltransferase involved in cell wall biosynthesis